MSIQRVIRVAAMSAMTAGMMMAAVIPARAMQAQVKWVAASGPEVEWVAAGDPQVKDELFAGTEKFAKGASDVTDVNLDPGMLGMVSGKHGGDLARKMNFMVVRSYTYPHKGMYSVEDVEAYRQKLKSGWNCFIHTYESESGESTDICNRALPNNQGNEMVIMTVEPKELTFIHMSGNASLADLGKLGAMGGHMPEPPTPPTPPTPPSPPSPR
jgi:hypothetical protein